MPRSVNTGSTIRLTSSNTDNNCSHPDNVPMDGTVTMKVPAEVAAEWIAKGVGVLASHSPLTQSQHNFGANKSAWTGARDNHVSSTAIKKREKVVIAHLIAEFKKREAESDQYIEALYRDIEKDVLRNDLSSTLSPMASPPSVSLPSLHCLTPPVSKPRWTALASDGTLETIEDQDISPAPKVCRGCWTGCDACCPRLEDADYQPPAPVGSRMGRAACECGRCDYCVESRVVDYDDSKEAKRFDLQDEQEDLNAITPISKLVHGAMDTHPTVTQGDEIDPLLPIREAFAIFGLQNQESVSMDKLKSLLRSAYLKAPHQVPKYGQAFAVIVKHQRKTGSWTDVTITNEKTSGHANAKQVGDKKTVNNSAISSQDEVRSLTHRNKQVHDDINEVEPPGGDAFSFSVRERAMNTGIADHEAATTPKKDAGLHLPFKFWQPAQSYRSTSPSHEQTLYPPSKVDEPVEDNNWLTLAPKEGSQGGSNLGWSTAPPSLSRFVHSNDEAIPHSSFEGLFDSSDSSDFPYPIPKPAAVRQPSDIDPDSGPISPEISRLPNKPLTITYSATVQCGDKTVNIPIDSKNVSGSEKDVMNGGMKKVWKWAVEKGLGDKIDLQDAFDLAIEMHGEYEEKVAGGRENPVVEMASERDRRVDGNLWPAGGAMTKSCPPSPVYESWSGWGKDP